MMAVAYRAVELADVCYIFEFAHWLALGQIPEIAPNEYGEEARRLPQEHDDVFEPVIDATLFLSEEEIARFCQR